MWAHTAGPRSGWIHVAWCAPVVCCVVSSISFYLSTSTSTHTTHTYIMCNATAWWVWTCLCRWMCNAYEEKGSCILRINFINADAECVHSRQIISKELYRYRHPPAQAQCCIHCIALHCIVAGNLHALVCCNTNKNTTNKHTPRDTNKKKNKKQTK